MKIKVLSAALAALSLSAVATAQAVSMPEFTAEGFKAHVAFLADDLLEGRAVGTRGYDLGAHYVATRFSALGLTPAANGSWYQRVPFVEFDLADGPASVTIGGRSFPNRGDVLVGKSPFEGAPALEAPVVFVGYGIDAPELGFNDYQGLDVKGKYVVALTGVPSGTPGEFAAHLNSDKARMAAERGAVGFLTVATREQMARQPWSRSISAPNHSSFTWVGTNGQPYTSAPSIRHSAALNGAAAEALFAGAPSTLNAVLDQAAVAGGRPKGFALKQNVKVERQVKTSKTSSPNVVAILPGSDPKLANEYVLMMAHLDGYGIDPSKPGDNISNGAMDNATGVATLLETARAMATSGKRPRRPILFAAVTAEEKGLLGAQYMAKNPVLKDGKIVAVVNLDMPVLTYDFTDVTAFGAENSTLGPIVTSAAQRMNVQLGPDPLPEERLFTRSDHYRFVQEGVPAVFLMTGFSNGGEAAFRGFLKDHYHKVSDDLNLPINWSAGAKFARLNYLIAREIADADQAPRWYQGNFFGNTFAPSAPKAPQPKK